MGKNKRTKRDERGYLISDLPQFAACPAILVHSGQRSPGQVGCSHRAWSPPAPASNNRPLHYQPTVALVTSIGEVGKLCFRKMPPGTAVASVPATAFATKCFRVPNMAIGTRT